MAEIERMIFNICSSDLQKSKNFYTSLFDFEIKYNSEWFIHLTAKERNLELGIIDKKHEVVPVDTVGERGGGYLTFVVENADEFYEKAINNQFEILQTPRDTFYGQRRLLLKDPDGLVIDISSVIK